ncbi:MAG: cytochrome c [Rhodospirillaceae bacterium]|nr:cytochrome c [Rhodospirillaceae bacterium]
MGAAMTKTIILAVIVTGLGAVQSNAAEPSPSRGRDLFMKVGCYMCHGTQGQGSSAGLKLAPEPLPAEAIAQFIRATNTAMPAYSEMVLPDSDVADIAAFLETIPAARSPDSIPALKDLKASK